MREGDFQKKGKNEGNGTSTKKKKNEGQDKRKSGKNAEY